MDKKKTASIGLIAGGIAIVVLVLIADQIGIGSPEHGFGRNQMLGAAVGGVVAVVGLVLAFTK